MKKRIVVALVVLMSFALIVTGCTPTPDAPAQSGGDAPSASEDAGDKTASDSADGDDSNDGESSYDKLMNILADPSADILPLSGVQPKEYPSRENINKGFPVEQKDDLTIAWAGASLGTEFFEGMKQGAEDTSEKYGYTLNYQNANFNLETQSTQIDSFISQAVDVMVLNAVDLHSSTQLMQSVANAGIPVIVTGPTSAKNDYPIVTAVIADSVDGAFQVGSYFAEKMYKKGEVLKVGWVISKLEDADSNARPCGWIAGFLSKSAEMDGTPYESKYDAILEAYDVWLQYKVDFKYDLTDKGLDLCQLGVGQGNDAAAGQKASSDMLTAHPDMDILMCEMDAEAIGAIAEIKQHGLVPGEDIIVGTCADGTRSSLELIKSGEMLATAANSPVALSTSLVELIHKIFTENYDANNMPATSYTPMVAITPDNIDEYYDPDSNFAKSKPFELITIPEYNELHKND